MAAKFVTVVFLAAISLSGLAITAAGSAGRVASPHAMLVELR
jgi:hypothetical protein